MHNWYATASLTEQREYDGVASLMLSGLKQAGYATGQWYGSSWLYPAAGPYGRWLGSSALFGKSWAAGTSWLTPLASGMEVHGCIRQQAHMV